MEIYSLFFLYLSNSIYLSIYLSESIYLSIYLYIYISIYIYKYKYIYIYTYIIPLSQHIWYPHDQKESSLAGAASTASGGWAPQMSRLVVLAIEISIETP